MSIPPYREDGKIIPFQKKFTIELPDEVDLTVTGNPLENHPTWKYTTCPETGAEGSRNRYFRYFR